MPHRNFTIFYAIGPALAAVIVSQVAHGKTGVRDLLKGSIRWRVGPVWYIVAVLGPVVLFTAAQVITKLLGLTETNVMSITRFSLEGCANDSDSIDRTRFAMYLSRHTRLNTDNHDTDWLLLSVVKVTFIIRRNHCVHIRFIWF